LGNISTKHKNFKLKLSTKTGVKLNFTEIRNQDIKLDLNPNPVLNLDLDLKSGFETGFESEILI
jgi:hypothetical protein